MAPDTRILTLQVTLRRAAVFCALALGAALYLADLTGMGILPPDEPRYADIGRTMAQTGDWITPRLWGKPWFEKPPLLYWMTAIGFKLGLSPDLAPRLPLAILSLGFLAFFWFRLRVLWDERVATCATVMLATTAGWLAYSHVAVTDLPMAAFFSAAVLFALDPDGDRTLPAACLGFATLAKSLVPLVLFAPVLAFDYRRLRQWLRPAPAGAWLLIAVPWHALCAVRNGNEFIRVLFIEHQFGRFTSEALQHVRPWWYYIPVLPLLLFPWFPLLALAPKSVADRRTRILAAVAVFGFAFFSASVNKLAGYLLPLLPAICILMALGLARAAKPARAMIAPAALLCALPIAARIVPGALSAGLRSTHAPFGGIAMAIGAGLAIALAVAMAGKRAFAVTASVAAAAWLTFQIATFRSIDAAASARPLWLAEHPRCVPGADRKLAYGLEYYAGRALPDCAPVDRSTARVVR